MPFVFLLIYTIFAVLQPWAVSEEAKVLADVRIMIWLAGIGSVATFVQLVVSRTRLGLPQCVLAPLFFGVVVFSLVTTGWFGGGWLAFANLFPALVFFFLIAANVNSLRRIRIFSLLLVLMGVYLSLCGIFAFLFTTDPSPYLNTQDSEVEIGVIIRRIRGLNFLADPNDFGQYLLACLPLAAMLWKKSSPIRNFLIVLLPITILSSGIYMTQSRGTLMGLAAVLFVVCWQRSKILAPFFAAGLTVALLALGYSSGRSVSLSGGTANERIEIWSDALSAAIHHPLIGIGYGNIKDFSKLTAHNSYLLCFVETGILGLFCWVALLLVHGLQLREVLRNTKLPPEVIRVAKFLAASYVSLLVTSFFLSRVYEFTIYIFLGLITSFVVAVRSDFATTKPLCIFQYKWLLATPVASCLVIGLVYVLVRLHWAGA